MARAATDELDGANAALQPVFALPSGQRIQQLTDGLDRVRRTLAVPRYAESQIARDIKARIAEFADVSGSAGAP